MGIICPVWRYRIVTASVASTLHNYDLCFEITYENIRGDDPPTLEVMYYNNFIVYFNFLPVDIYSEKCMLLCNTWNTLL
jgi:hypothetical protein